MKMNSKNEGNDSLTNERTNYQQRFYRTFPDKDRKSKIVKRIEYLTFAKKLRKINPAKLNFQKITKLNPLEIQL